jgi:VCBS repeat-containing protein
MNRKTRAIVFLLVLAATCSVPAVASAVKPPGAGAGPTKGELSLSTAPGSFNEADDVTVAVSRTSSKGEARVTLVPSLLSTGSAAQAGDFDPTRIPVVFPAGVSTVSVTVPVTDDAVVEPDESFRLDLAAPSKGYSLAAGASGGDVVILNDDTATNTAPNAVDDPASVGEDSTGATVAVLDNDTDGDGDTLSITMVDTTGTTGLVTNNGTDVTYDPNGSFENLHGGQTATDTFTYAVSDGNGGTDTATVTVTVTGIEDPPNANDDAYSTDEDTAQTGLNVLANDTDPEEPLTLCNVDTTGTTGTVTHDGTFVTYDPNGQFDSLNAGETATDTFTYCITDGTTTDYATVTLTVNGV